MLKINLVQWLLLIANLLQCFGCIIQINTLPDKLSLFTPPCYKGTSFKFWFFLILNTKNAALTRSFNPSSPFSPGTKLKWWQPRLLSSVTSRDVLPTAQSSGSGCCGTKSDSAIAELQLHREQGFLQPCSAPRQPHLWGTERSSSGAFGLYQKVRSDCLKGSSMESGELRVSAGSEPDSSSRGEAVDLGRRVTNVSSAALMELQDGSRVTAEPFRKAQAAGHGPCSGLATTRAHHWHRAISPQGSCGSRTIEQSPSKRLPEG